MSRIVFVRHSIPQIDPEVPSRDWALSPEGIADSQIMARSLDINTADVIVSSTERKAVETAGILAAQRGCSASQDGRLCEHGRASLGFLSKVEFEAGIERFFAQPGDRVFGDDSADAVFTRFNAAIEDISEREGTRVFVITHGTALSAYLARKVQLNAFELWKSLKMPMVLTIEAGVLKSLTP